jgi:hypothetical protein
MIICKHSDSKGRMGTFGSQMWSHGLFCPIKYEELELSLLIAFPCSIKASVRLEPP